MVKILGIETSCDETAVAVVTEKKEVLFNEVISQINEHQKYGGVVPEVAARSHLNALDGLLQKLNATIGFEKIDAIAVTAGPGLIGGVVVGVTYAKAIAMALKKPIIAVNHLEGHALTIRLTENVDYPFLLLLVSGGHSKFLIVKGVGDYILLGETLDDALGESFDKVAKMLGIGYPGGPLIEQIAKNGNEKCFNFPRPLCQLGNCNLSFSGLKTAVRTKIESLKTVYAPDIAASFQYTVTEVLKIKSKNALKKYYELMKTKPKTFVLSGGVAANLYIRKALQHFYENEGVEFQVPPIKLCGDNAAMIAWVGVERYELHKFNDLSFSPYSKGSLF